MSKNVLEKHNVTKNIVKAMEDVPVSGLEIYKQNKENVKNINGCYVRYPSENSIWPGDSVWPGGYRYFYLDFSAFNSNEQNERLKDLREQGCYVFGEVISPGNVDLKVLKEPNGKTTDDLFLGDEDKFDNDVYLSMDVLGDVKKILDKGDDTDNELIKLADELYSLEYKGRLFEYKNLVEGLSADVNGKRCYDFRNVENNSKLYYEIVKLVDYLSKLELKQKNALKAKGV